MKNTIKIDKGVPLPDGYGTNGSKYPFEQMKVSDSFALPKSKRNTISPAVNAYKKKHKGLEFITRTVGTKIRVWRTK